MTALAVDDMPEPERRPAVEPAEEAGPRKDGPIPGWLMPPQDGFTAEDLDHLPQLPPHSELIDGSIVLVSPQADFHSLTVDLLVAALRRFIPETMRVRREMTVTVARRQRPEPDIVVLRAEGVTGRDRERKPELYAEAGIPHFWRVENTGGQPVVHVFALDPATKAYVPSGVHHNRLKLSVPFDIDIDLTEIDRL